MLRSPSTPAVCPVTLDGSRLDVKSSTGDPLAASKEAFLRFRVLRVLRVYSHGLVCRVQDVKV